MSRHDQKLRQELAAMPTEITPTRDLWAGIEARLERPEGAPPLEEVTSIASARGWSAFRHRSVSVEWAIAASVALASVVGGSIWMSMQSPTVDSTLAAGPAPGQNAVPAGAQGDPSFVPADLSQYETAAVELEEIIETGRELLGPQTLEVLQNSLAAIDQAITEAQQALSTDPGHTGLQRMLQQNHRRKLGLLRQAATAVQSRT